MFLHLFILFIRRKGFFSMPISVSKYVPQHFSSCCGTFSKMYIFLNFVTLLLYFFEILHPCYDADVSLAQILSAVIESSSKIESSRNKLLLVLLYFQRERERESDVIAGNGMHACTATDAFLHMLIMNDCSGSRGLNEK